MAKKQKWQKPVGERSTNFETLRKHSDELRLVSQTLAPPEAHEACVSMLYYVLRNWNRRSPRFDRHFGGDWLFLTHEQLVFYGVVSSVRTSKRALTLLNKTGFIDRRKAHLGEKQNVLHLAPSTPLLGLLDKLNGACFCCLTLHERPRVMRYLCDQSIKCGPGQMENKTLVYVGERMRTDGGYGSAQRGEDMHDAMRQARDRYKKQPDPFVKSKSSASSDTSQFLEISGARANSGTYETSASASSGKFPIAEKPNLALTSKVGGNLVGGDLKKGDSGFSQKKTETKEIVVNPFTMETKIVPC